MIGLEILASYLHLKSIILIPDSFLVSSGLAAGLSRRQTVIIFQVIFAILGGLIDSRFVEAQ